MLKIIAIAMMAVAAMTTTVAADFDGLSVGVHGATVSTYMDKDYTRKGKATLNDQSSAYGVHARFLLEQNDFVAGAEVRYDKYPNTIINAGRGNEAVTDGLDISGILGYQQGSIMPHIIFGMSILEAKKPNDGMHYGLGVSYSLTDNVMITARGVKYEFDGPWQGSDLDLIKGEIQLSWRF